MPLDGYDQDLARLTRLRVLHLDESPRARSLTCLGRYYDQRHNDHLEYEFDGRQREPGASYMELRQRGLGMVPARQDSIPFGARRPDCPTSITGYVVDTYTALLLGEGRQPSLRVVGDDLSSELLEAALDYCDGWDALAEARTIAGSEGAAAIVPDVIEGELCLRALRPEHLYVEWSNARDWVPRIVIEQKRVSIETLDEETGHVGTATVWRTRAWDSQFAYIYKDIIDRPETQPAEGPAQRQEADDDVIELAQEPIPHGADRCPVIWLQNTRSSDDPIGKTDCEGVYEQIDKLDRLLSMIVRGVCANNDPTLLVKDKMHMLKLWPTRAKGYGNKIEVSEAGDARLIEITGKTFETSWLTAEKLIRHIELRTGVIAMDPEQAATAISGVALQLLWRTQDSRVSARRKPLGRAIMQLCRVLLSMFKQLGIKAIGSDGKGIELPPRETKQEGKDKPVLEQHKPGPGGAIVLNWPAHHAPTPTDLQTTAQALSVAAGGRQVLSQQSAVGVMVNVAQTDTDVATELERIRAEERAKADSFKDSMTADADAELTKLEDEAAEPADGPIQEQAMNAGQIKEMVNTLAAAGDRLAPETTLFVLQEAFPHVNEARAKAAIDKQIAFAEETPKPEPPAPGFPPKAADGDEQDDEDDEYAPQARAKPESASDAKAAAEANDEDAEE